MDSRVHSRYGPTVEKVQPRTPACGHFSYCWQAMIKIRNDVNTHGKHGKSRVRAAGTQNAAYHLKGGFAAGSSGVTDQTSSPLRLSNANVPSFLRVSRCPWLPEKDACTKLRASEK